MTTRRKPKEPAQVARYHLEKGELPESLNSQTGDYLFDLNQALHRAVPHPISIVIAYVPQQGRLPHEEIELYVFGSFRSAYKVVDGLADLFAGLYTKYTILPLVNPVTKAEWEVEVEHNGRVKQNIQTDGIVIYER